MVSVDVDDISLQFRPLPGMLVLNIRLFAGGYFHVDVLRFLKVTLLKTVYF